MKSLSIFIFLSVIFSFIACNNEIISPSSSTETPQSSIENPSQNFENFKFQMDTMRSADIPLSTNKASEYWNIVMNQFSNSPVCINYRDTLSNFHLPPTFTINDSIIIVPPYPWPGSGSKSIFTLFYPTHSLNYTFIWQNVGYMFDSYALPLYMQYALENQALLITMGGFSQKTQLIYMAGNLDTILCPTADPQGNCLKLQESRVYNNRKLIIWMNCLAHGIYYNAGFKCIDLVTHEETAVYWTYPYNYFFH